MVGCDANERPQKRKTAPLNQAAFMVFNISSSRSGSTRGVDQGSASMGN